MAKPGSWSRDASRFRTANRRGRLGPAMWSMWRPKSRTSSRLSATAASRCSASTSRKSSSPTGLSRPAGLGLLPEQQHAPQADRAHEDAPVGEGREAVLADEVEGVAHHDEGEDEGRGEANAHGDAELARDEVAALVEIVAEGPGHQRDGDEEAELGGRALVGAQQQRADDRGARTRHAGDQRQHLEQADIEAEERGILVDRAV